MRVSWVLVMAIPCCYTIHVRKIHRSELYRSIGKLLGMATCNPGNPWILHQMSCCWWMFVPASMIGADSCPDKARSFLCYRKMLVKYHDLCWKGKGSLLHSKREKIWKNEPTSRGKLGDQPREVLLKTGNFSTSRDVSGSLGSHINPICIPLTIY